MSATALLVLAGATPTPAQLNHFRLTDDSVTVSEFETALFAQPDEDQSNRLSLLSVVEQSEFARRLHVVTNKRGDHWSRSLTPI